MINRMCHVKHCDIKPKENDEFGVNEKNSD